MKEKLAVYITNGGDFTEAQKILGITFDTKWSYYKRSFGNIYILSDVKGFTQNVEWLKQHDYKLISFDDLISSLQ